MEIKLFEPEDMKTGRGGGKRGTGDKYSKYKSAIGPHLAFLKDGIAQSKDGNVRVKVEDLAKAMGMTGKHETSIYWGLKYTLFAEGLVVTTGQTKANEPVLVIREKKDGDVLPASLTKHMAADAGKGGSEAPEEEKTGSEE